MKVLLYMFIVPQPSMDKAEDVVFRLDTEYQDRKKTSYVKSDREQKKDDDEDEEETEELVALGII